MRIDGYEVNNGRVIAVFITDEKRNIKQHKYEPARPHGEWIYHKEWELDGECAFECSKCGMGVDVDYNFCPKCGSDNRKKGEAK